MLNKIISLLPRVSNLGSGRATVREPVTPEKFNEVVVILNNNQKTLEEGITALAGGGQANAVVLSNINSIISVVATAADSVKFDSFIEGSEVSVKNSGASALNIFPPVGGNLGAGVNTAISLLVGDTIEFLRLSAANVFSQIVNIPSVIANDTITEGITAFATGGQANGTLLTSHSNVVSIVGSIGDSVKLAADPNFTAGKEILIINTSGDSMDVFPFESGDIGAGADTAVAVAGGAQLRLLKIAATDEYLNVT